MKIVALKQLVVIGLFIFSLHAIRAQEKIYFPYFEIIGISNDTLVQYSASKFIQTYITEYHHPKYELILPPKGQGIYEPEQFARAIDRANGFGAEYYLRGEINALGRIATISMQLFKVDNQSIVWKDLGKGIPLDDLDPVLTRFARNFMGNIKVNEDGSIYDVSEYEEDREIRLADKKTNYFTGIMLGGNYLMGEMFNTRFGINQYADASKIIVKWSAEYSTNRFFSSDPEAPFYSPRNKLRAGALGLELNIPLQKTRDLFYLDLGTEVAFIGFYREDLDYTSRSGGLGFITGIGYLIGRVSALNVRIEAQSLIPTYTTDNRYLPQFKFGLIVTSFHGKRLNHD